MLTHDRENHQEARPVRASLFLHAPTCTRLHPYSIARHVSLRVLPLISMLCVLAYLEKDAEELGDLLATVKSEVKQLLAAVKKEEN